MQILNIENLSIKIEDKNILENINLKVNSGEVHVIMGPNGSGKSTLFNVIMGNPIYEVSEKAVIEYLNEDIRKLDTSKRAKRGIFLSFQNPKEIPGISVAEFLRQSKIAVTGKEIGIIEFNLELQKEMRKLNLLPEYATRYFNQGFSGGEKKKMEMLQLNILKPRLALLDETDSGLDIDALKIVSENVKKYLSEDNAVIIITHHREILESLDIDYVHIIRDGKIIRTGKEELITKLEEIGYESIDEE